MSRPNSAASATSLEARRVQVAKKVVLVLACVVGATLVTAAVFGVVGYATDRPIKELFNAQ